MSTGSTNTQSLRQRDLEHVLHAYSHLPTLEKEGCLVISRGEGAYVYDTEDRQYLDGVAALWCVNVGYGRDEIVEVMAEQARKLAFYSSFSDITNPPMVELAARIAELAPEHMNHVHFGSGGTDANEMIARTMHHYFHRLGKPSKRLFLSRHHAYHGTSLLAMSLGRKPEDRLGFSFLDDWVHHLDFPGLYRVAEGVTPEEHLEELVRQFERKVQELGSENIAGFFAEPINFQ